MVASVDPANVVQSLVYTLLDVFDATRDLYNTLRNKEKRDYESSLRSKGYPDSRRIEYIDEDDFGSDEGIVIDKAAVKRQFDDGLQDIGSQFAIGDVVSQTALQAQIITLQSVLITTFLYGPTSRDPISHQLAGLLAASRAAGTASVDALSEQHRRQAPVYPPTPRSTRSHSVSQKAPPYPVTSASSTSTALVKSKAPTLYPAHTTILDLSRPKTQRTDTESTSFSGPTSYGAESTPRDRYCLYAADLQRHPSQSLAPSITNSSAPYCPHCTRDLNLSPGKSWEISKDDEGVERTFRIQNRFVVKCHRDGADGGYLCILCSRSDSTETVCGDVRALIRHIWMDHHVSEFELEEDIVEKVEKVDRRRDSALSYTETGRRGDRRSLSLGPGRNRRRLPDYQREVEILEVRKPRRDD